MDTKNRPSGRFFFLVFRSELKTLHAFEHSLPIARQASKTIRKGNKPQLRHVSAEQLNRMVEVLESDGSSRGYAILSSQCYSPSPPLPRSHQRTAIQESSSVRTSERVEGSFDPEIQYSNFNRW